MGGTRGSTHKLASTEREMSKPNTGGTRGSTHKLASAQREGGEQAAHRKNKEWHSPPDKCRERKR